MLILFENLYSVFLIKLRFKRTSISGLWFEDSCSAWSDLWSGMEYKREAKIVLESSLRHHNIHPFLLITPFNPYLYLCPFRTIYISNLCSFYYIRPEDIKLRSKKGRTINFFALDESPNYFYFTSTNFMKSTPLRFVKN